MKKLIRDIIAWFFDLLPSYRLVYYCAPRGKELKLLGHSCFKWKLRDRMERDWGRVTEPDRIWIERVR